MHAAAPQGGGTAYRPAPDAACTCTAPSRRFAIKKDTEPYCALVMDLWTKGHEIALHTYDHVRLDPPIDEEKKSEPASQSVNPSFGQSRLGQHARLAGGQLF
jgi:peptidoglycan/xylan/chitin deacetylase (PgdA/CDA1 family)